MLEKVEREREREREREQGLGAMLAKEKMDTHRPIRFLCRALTPTEANYANNEWECLTVLWAIENWRVYLIGKEFKLYTIKPSKI